MGEIDFLVAASGSITLATAASHPKVKKAYLDVAEFYHCRAASNKKTNENT